MVFRDYWGSWSKFWKECANFAEGPGIIEGYYCNKKPTNKRNSLHLQEKEGFSMKLENRLHGHENNGRCRTKLAKISAFHLQAYSFIKMKRKWINSLRVFLRFYYCSEHRCRDVHNAFGMNSAWCSVFNFLHTLPLHVYLNMHCKLETNKPRI